MIVRRLAVILAAWALFLATALFSADVYSFLVPKRPLLDVDNWGYQLQALEPNTVSADNAYDLLVIDYSNNGSEGGRFTRQQIEHMKQRPSGRRRIVLSYLSIGEAEAYRYYWQPNWRPGSPAWLLSENRQWKGNYVIKFWDPQWKEIIFGGDNSYLKRIIEAGFDGVYLDRVDVYHEVTRHNRAARSAMIEFVKELAAQARRLQPGFLIVPQNAEDLIRDPSYLRLVDGFGIEDLLFGVPGEGKRNNPSEIAERAELLRTARRAGKGVFIVEYLANRADIERARTEILTMEPGFIPYVVAPRDLGKMKTENLELHEEPE